MRKTITLAVAMSVLLGAGAVQAEPDATAAASNPVVGSERSNVDEKSSSGSYYPNSAGTVGDDPAHPKSTAIPPDTNVDPDPGEPTEQTGNVDSDGDDKLTRSECKAWYESQQANDSAPSSVTPAGNTGS
jgi:hypothetical protein